MVYCHDLATLLASMELLEGETRESYHEVRVGGSVMVVACIFPPMMIS